MAAEIEVSSLVLYTHDLDRAAAFYRAVGLPLDHEDHDDGPAHQAAELGGIHFALYRADGDGRSPGWREVGSAFPGFYIRSLDDVTQSIRDLGAPVLEEHEPMPWGCRIVAEDPDGRAVEIIERGHCPA